MSSVDSTKGIQIRATPEALEYIRDAGGMLFVSLSTSISSRVRIVVLRASCELPPRAFEFRRCDLGDFLLFFDPRIRSFPRQLDVDLAGRRKRRIAAYWNGLAYLM